MRAESMKCGRSGVLFDADAAPVLAHPFVVDVARDGREQGVVAAYADAASGRDLRAALADQDRSGVDELSAVDLHPEHLRVRVAAVARRTSALLVCQLLSLPLAPPARGLLGRLGCLFGFRFRGLRFRSRLFLRRRLGPAAAPALRLRVFLFFLFRLEPDAADRDDLEGGQVGTTSVVHPHTLLGLVADALDARPAAVHDHPGVDFDAVSLRSDLRLLAVAEQQHATDLHGRSRFGREAVDQDAVPGCHAVLLSAADDDGRRRTIRLGHGERLYQGAGAACLRAPSPCYTRLPDSLIASARGWT